MAVIAVVLLIVLGLGLYAVFAGTYSEGYRVGQIAKVSKKGFLFKTWEGELQLGFLETDMQSGGVATRSWAFSIDNNPAVIADVDLALKNAVRVKLNYHERYVILPWMSETRYIVFKVEGLGPEPVNGTSPVTNEGGMSH